MFPKKWLTLWAEKRKSLKLITCHIGNGSSITAVKGGKVIDTTMGLTPLGGFMMECRSGSLDPSVITFIAEKEHLTPEEMSKILNKESGLLGISGVSSDDRDVCAAEADGNMRASPCPRNALLPDCKVHRQLLCSARRL